MPAHRPRLAVAGARALPVAGARPLAFAGAGLFVLPLLAALLLGTPLLLPSTLQAQTVDSNSFDRLLDRVGYTLGGGSGSHGFAFGAAVSLSAGPGDVLLRFVDTGFGDGAGDQALLYGLRAATPGGRLWGRASVGLGLATESRMGERYNCRWEGPGFPFLWEVCDQDTIEEKGLGVAYHLEGVWQVASSWGLGLTWFGSEGGPARFNGWSVQVYLGR
jgi:hypothetical protein